MNADWKIKYREIIESFLIFLNKHSDDYVLKGGTALMECYSLDRFSEDIDLDGYGSKIIDIVDSFCKLNNIEYTFFKNTNTVKKFMLHFEDNGHPIKIEVSYRKQYIDNDEKVKINGITVYEINSLMGLKLNAYLYGEKLRDLYDVCFIYNNYKDKLNKTIIRQVRNAFAYKGFGYIDYITETQEDDLIHKTKLRNMFIDAYESLKLEK